MDKSRHIRAQAMPPYAMRARPSFSHNQPSIPAAYPLQCLAVPSTVLQYISTSQVGPQNTLHAIHSRWLLSSKRTAP